MVTATEISRDENLVYFTLDGFSPIRYCCTKNSWDLRKLRELLENEYKIPHELLCEFESYLLDDFREQ